MLENMCLIAHKTGKLGAVLILNWVSNPIGESENVLAILLNNSTNSSISLGGIFSCVDMYSNTFCAFTVGSISRLSHCFLIYLSCTCDINELYKFCTLICSVSHSDPCRFFLAHKEFKIPANYEQK